MPHKWIACLALFFLTLPAIGQEASDPAGDPPANIRFQFDGMPYADVVRQFAQMAGKPILGEVEVGGELTFFDSQPYTYQEALDTLNIILAMQGQMLV